MTVTEHFTDILRKKQEICVLIRPNANSLREICKKFKILYVRCSYCLILHFYCEIKRSPMIILKSRVLYPGPGFLSIATWPSLLKKHYNH